MKRHLSKFLILCLSAMLVCSTAFVGLAAEPGDGEGSDNGAISAQNEGQNESGGENGENPSETPEKNSDEEQPEDSTDSASLDGKTFAIVNVPKKAAMQSNTIENGNLAAKDVSSYLQEDATNGYRLVLRSEKEKDAAGITQWMFTSVDDDNPNHYYVTTTVDGETKYLKIGASKIELVTAPSETEDKPVITVTAGEEEKYKGLFRLSADGVGTGTGNRSYDMAVNIYGDPEFIDNGFGRGMVVMMSTNGRLCAR